MLEDVPTPLRRLKKTSSEFISDPSKVEGGTSFFVPPSSAVGLVKSWTIPDVQGIENTISREKFTTLAAQHIASVSIFDMILSFSNNMFMY